VKDEEYLYISDVIDKKITARSARHTRTHCGKGGRVRFPSDNLSKKELNAMNGETNSYRMHDPVSWKEFKLWPDDIKVMYIKLLRKKFNVPGKNIAEMLGCCSETFSKEINRLGISQGQNCRGRFTPWDRDGFYAWVSGADIPTQVTEEEPAEAPVIEEAPVHFYTEEDDLGEVKGYVEDDLPFEEPDHFQGELSVALHAEIDALKIRIDELLKINEELNAVREKDKAHIAWLEVRVDELGTERLMLEKQMDVVRLIFGGKNNG
jgi:DNA repair exonuclease SbcCD nuclease subunit